MAMQTVRESLLSDPHIPWWNAFGSQPLDPATLAGDSDSFHVRSAGETEHRVDKQRNSASHLAFSLDLTKTNLWDRHCHSRHLHALRRPRGSGGRFLNTKSKKADETEQTHPQPQQSISQSSKVLHPESEIMNLSSGLDVPGSEVTSINYFLGSSVHPLCGMVMPSKWLAAAAVDNGCCSFST